MAKVRVEFITLGESESKDAAPNVLVGMIGSGVTLDVTSTATTAGNRPTAPAFAGNVKTGEVMYARVSGVTGAVVVAWGTNPTATQANGVLVMEGSIELIPVEAGQRLSFIELA